MKKLTISPVLLQHPLPATLILPPGAPPEITEETLEVDTWIECVAMFFDASRKRIYRFAASSDNGETWRDYTSYPSPK